LYKECFKHHGLLPEQVRSMPMEDLAALCEEGKKGGLSYADAKAHVEAHRAKQKPSTPQG